MLKTILIPLALFGSLSAVAQEAPSSSCPFFGPELRKVLALDQVQCERIATIHKESWPSIQPLSERLEVLTNQVHYLSWTEELPAHEAARRMAEVILERRKMLEQIRSLEAGRNRNILQVLNHRQRQVIDQLIAAAPVVRLFNEATAGGLIPPEIAFPVGSPTLASADRSRRQ